VKLVLDPAAKAEMREAALFYEHCREGLGEEFLDAVELAFAEITQRPMTWRILNGRFRRYLVHHYPYAVIYAVEDETIYVAAIMHMRRKPDYWHDRVRDQ
jgi:toxin ParE1/3/4